MDPGRLRRPESRTSPRGRRASDGRDVPTSTQVIGALLAILIAVLGFYVERLSTDIDRLIDTQRQELQRLSVLETQAKYNADAIRSIDDRIRVEVEIPEGIRH